MPAAEIVDLSSTTPMEDNEIDKRFSTIISDCQAIINFLRAEISEHNRVIGFIIRRLNGETLSTETGHGYLNQLSGPTLYEEKRSAEQDKRNAEARLDQAEARLDQALQDKRNAEQDIRVEKQRQHEINLARLTESQRSPVPVNPIVTGQNTMIGQGSASSFCKAMANGLGYLPLGTAFDPTYHWTTSLTSMLIPSSEDVQKAGYLNISAQTPGYGSCKESDGVVSMTMEALRESFKNNFVENHHKSLKDKGLSVGIASETSFNDVEVELNGLHLLEFENKGGEVSVMPGMAQAAATATNFCIGLRNAGIPFDKCIVPVVVNTGLSMCFAATILLDQSFPTCIPLSKSLDLLNQTENKLAHAYLTKAFAHVHHLSNIGREEVSKISQYVLRTDAAGPYYVKTYNREVFDRGLGLFSRTAEVADIQPGINHMFRCLNQLYSHPQARHVVAFPLSIRTPDKVGSAEDGCGFYELIFENLSLDGYRIGTPPRRSDEYDIFVGRLKEAMQCVHETGVIHLDLYASNVMWKKSGDDICIKIIDWDAAHCLSEGKYAVKIREALCRRFSTSDWQFSQEHDLMYLEAYELTFDEVSVWYDAEKLFDDLASTDKARIDLAFWNLLVLTLDKRLRDSTSWFGGFR